MNEDTRTQMPMRLDRHLARSLRCSRAQAVKHIREGRVRCNGIVIRKASKIISPGDQISLAQGKELRDGGHRTKRRSTKPLPILYEDPTCLVIDKPQGIVVHPTGTMDAAEPTILDLLLQEHHPAALLLVHRLDRGTSGCLLIAKNAESCEALQRQFKERTVKKTYLAIVMGLPHPAQATIDAPIGRSLVDRTRMSLFRTSRTRGAVTTYTTIAEGNDCALLACDIATGRTHQSRLHLAEIGHPILGDMKYGNERSRQCSREHGMTAPCLHAWRLEFTSPATKKRVEVLAPMPEEFRRAAEQWGLQISEGEPRV